MHFSLNKKTIQLGFIGLLLIGTLATLFLVRQVQEWRSRAAATDWVQVGLHPHASRHPTVGYKTLNKIIGWDGKIYSVYGGNGHMGPVTLDTFDPITRTFTKEYDLYSDASNHYTTGNHFRALFGKLYIPTYNGIHEVKLEAYVVKEPGKNWLGVDNLNMSYATDIATTNGKDFFYTGNSHTDYSIDQSNDSGVSWAYDVQPSVSSHLGVYNGKLYATTTAGSRVYDGTSWTTGPTLGTMYLPVVFQNKLLYKSSYLSGTIKTYNGSTVATVLSDSILDFAVYGNSIYTLGANTTRTVKKSTDLATWTIVTDSPSTARSITVLNGKLYIGTTDSKIYEYNTPVSTLPEVVIRSDDNELSEDGNGGSFKVSRTGSLTNSLIVNYTVSGKATNGTDYSSLSGSVTIPSGQQEVSVPVVPVSDFLTTEGDESLVVTLSSTTSYNAGLPLDTILTIYEKPAITVTTSDEYGAEPNNPVQFTFKRRGSTANPLTVQYTNEYTVNEAKGVQAVNGVDYQTIPMSITIPAGSTTATLTVNPIDESLSEGDEDVSIEVSVSAAYSREIPNHAEALIFDNDMPNTPNLIPNPSFEIDIVSPFGVADGWYGIQDKTIFRTGAASEKIDSPTPDLASTYWHQGPSLTPGKTYIIRGYVKTDGDVNTRGVNLQLIQILPSTIYNATKWVKDSNEWRQISTEAKIPLDNTSNSFRINWNINAAPFAWVDDVSLQEATNDTTPFTPVIPQTTTTPQPTPSTPPPTPSIITPTATLIPPSPTPTRTPTPLPTNTPTPLPTSTPIPTATPIPDSTKFNLNLLLHGVGKVGDNANPIGTGNLTPLHPQKTVNLEMYNNANTLVKSVSGTITYNTTNGNFVGVIDAGTGIANGDYLVKVKGLPYLRRQIGGFFTLTSGQTITLPQSILTVGDANSDNQLDILDYNLLLDCYSELSPPRNCDAAKLLSSDFNDDGLVNHIDYNLFLRELSVITGD